MKRMRARGLRHAAAFCALLLLLTVPAAPASAASYVYFTSVNDKLLALSTETMPAVIGGILYVPCTVFDETSTGVNLGVFSSANRAQNTFVLYSRSKTLIFDLFANNCYDSQNTYRYMAVTKNSRIYLPASFVCDYFGLTFSYVITNITPLIRIKSADVVLSDKSFVNAAESLMQSRFNEYQLSLTPVTPVPPVTNDPADIASPEAPPVEEAIPVYLSFLCSDHENTELILDALDARNLSGLFLFSPDHLAEQDDLIRRILGSGHTIGFSAPDISEESLSRLEAGNRLLRVIARSAARIVSVPGLTSDAARTLEQQGWTGWVSSINGIYTSGSSSAASSNIIVQLDKQEGAIQLQMDDSDRSIEALPRILRHLDSGGFAVCITFETLFPCR